MNPLAAAAAALLAAASPFVAEEPRVKEGNEKLLSGDAPGALEAYDRAEREAGPRPEIDFDRGDALHAAGRHAEAREAWRRALERDPSGKLASRALQNTASALEAEGDEAGAVRALGEALRRDPANEDARYNLEVLLRRKGSGKGKPRDEGPDGSRRPGPPDEGKGDQPTPRPDQDRQGQQGQPRQEPEPGKGADERRRAGEDERREQGTKDGRPEGPERAADAGERSAPITRQDAERLLDALRARERQLPLGPAGRKDRKPREADRDW